MEWTRRPGPAALALILASLALADRPLRGDDGPQAATRRYAVAAGFQNRKLAKQAAEEWRKFLAEFPKDPRRDKAQHALGVCLLQDGQVGAAIDAFRALIASSPAYDQLDAVYLNLGVAHFRRAREKKAPEDDRAAADAFATLIQKYPKSPLVPRALFNQAEEAYQAGKLADAAAGYTRLIKEHPQSDLAPDATYALGVAQDQLHQPEQASATFAEFLARYPSHALAPECRLRRAEAAFALKKPAEAEVFFKQAADTKGFPYADYARLRQAGCLHERGKTHEAALLYQEVAKVFPASPYVPAALLAAGKCLYSEHQYGPAGEILAKIAARTGPEAAEAAYWQGRCLLGEKKPERAVAVFEAALKAQPQSPSRPLLMFGLADATSEVKGRRAEAPARYAEFARTFPDDPRAAQAISLAAFSALDTGQADLAKALALEFLTRYPKHELRGEALFAAGEAELKARHFAEAAERFRAAVEAAPQSPHAEEARVRRGLALSLQNQDEAVIAALTPELPRLKDKALLAHAHDLIGRAHANRKRYGPAIDSLRAALAAKPDWALGDEVRLILAHALRAQGKPADAAAEARKLASDFPKSPVLDQAYLLLGDCAADQGRLDEALPAYREAAKRAAGGPSAAPAQVGIGRTLYRKDDLKGAVAAFDVVLQSFPQSESAPRARYLRALAEHKLKQDDRAIADVDAFLATKPAGDEALDARFLKGLCLADLGRHAEAADVLSALLKDHPKYVQATQAGYALAFSQKALKRDKDAAESFRRLAEANPTGPLAAESWFRFGEYEYGTGRYNEAEKAYRDALAKASDPGLKENVLHKLGWCAFKRGDYPAAASAFDRQAAEFPAGALVVDGRFLAAECEFKQGHWRAALDRLVAVEKAKPPAYLARTLYRSGQCAGELKEWPVAAAHYKRLLADYPKFEQAAEARYGLGWALQNQGNQRDAIAAYTEVIRETDTETAAKAQFMIGECYFALKEHAEAAKQFLKGAYGYPYEEWAGNAQFEAARCFEVLRQLDQARESYRILATKYPRHAKAKRAAERLKELGG